MADIFLSYARQDRQKAELLSRALEHAGGSVWWDREILPGTSYERLIEAELSSAHCVVVLWSDSARQSNWLLMIALASIGAWLWSGTDAGSRRESAATVSDERQPRESEAAVPGTSNRARPLPAEQALGLPAQASVTLARERVTLTILSGTLAPVNADTRLLSLHIRFANDGTSFYRTYYSNLRLIIGDVPRAPNDPPLEQVDAASARELDYHFDVPVAATRAVLRVSHDDQVGDIPLDLEERRR